jgi:hypothetical protein
MDYTDHAQLINTPHEDFVNSYVQRYETMRINATRVKQVHDEVQKSPVFPKEATKDPIVALDTTVEQVVALPELIITDATPASSPVKDITLSTQVHEVALATISDVPGGAAQAVCKHIAPAQPCDVTALALAYLPIEAVAPRVLPVMVNHEAAPTGNTTRPASAQSMCSSRDGSTLPASVFSRRASVTTKPSNESFGFDGLRLIDTLDFQVDVKSTPTTVLHHERSVSMPILTLSSPNTSETSTDVSESDQSAHAQATYVGPSTPVRAAPIAKKCLTPIFEVQTPLSSSSMPQTTMYASTAMDDSYEGFPTPNFHYPQPYVQNVSRATFVPRNDPVQPMPASVFTDDSSFIDCRPRSNKLTAVIKYRAQAVTGAAKQAARHLVCSVKNMRATAYYFVPATPGSRNPFETVSRR